MSVNHQNTPPYTISTNNQEPKDYHENTQFSTRSSVVTEDVQQNFPTNQSAYQSTGALYGTAPQHFPGTGAAMWDESRHLSIISTPTSTDSFMTWHSNRKYPAMMNSAADFEFTNFGNSDALGWNDEFVSSNDNTLYPATATGLIDFGNDATLDAPFAAYDFDSMIPEIATSESAMAFQSVDFDNNFDLNAPINPFNANMMTSGSAVAPLAFPMAFYNNIGTGENNTNTTTSDRGHQCPTCNKTCKRYRDLTRHQKSHSPPDLPCPNQECKRSGTNGFYRHDKLREHLLKCHGLNS